MPNTVRKENLSEAKRRLLEQRIRGDAPHRQSDRIQSRPTGTPIPISAEQYRIWLHASQQTDVPLYNEPITIHKRGSFDLAIFEAAFNQVLQRHEAWRSSFESANGELMQIVHPDLHVKLPLIDLTHLPPETREAEALRQATADAATPIALNRAPLFRARVFRLAPDDHRLHLTLHHIIFDGVSIYRILMPELAEIYTALQAGREPCLPQPSLQYGDYAVWRRRQVASPASLQHLEYWRTHLAGDLPVLRLPVDRARPAQISHRGSMECFEIPASQIHRLREVSKAHGVTLYMTLLAAFKTLLFRYSGQEDLIVGGATDARRRPELEGLMGYFLDTFAMRTRPSSDKRFADYVLEVRDAVLGALSAADVPFDRVVQAVNPARDSSHHPVFQAFFSIEPPVEPFAEGWDLTQMDVTVGSSKFDLYLELDERPDHMAARFMYNTDIFDAATIRRMSQHWLTLLESICATPNATLGRLQFLTAEEIAQLTAPGGWNDTAQSFPQITLQQIFEAQVQATPNDVAAQYGSERYTYAQLDERANQIAVSLRASGAAPETIVAVLLDRSLDLLAGLLAVLKTGAAHLPLDPETPAARIELFLDDANPIAILTQTSRQHLLQNSSTRIMLVDGSHTSTPGAPPQQSTHIGAPDDTAYVIYTSGTTGEPKAVEVSHRNLINLLTSMQKEPGFRDADTLLAVTTVSFDIAGLELFLPLISGGTVVITSREEAQDPFLLAQKIGDSGCTVMQATPSTWRALLGSGWIGSPRPLRVLCGGEPLQRDLADRLLAAGVELWNVYGPTETTIWSTVHRIVQATGPVSIGKPIANTTAHILDACQQLLPISVPGELYLGGDGLAKGYRDQPELTAGKFTHIETLSDARFYRTGDLAVRRADGTLECLGRVDNQVKVRGFRVELEAVEAAVQQHPKIAAAAARVWPEPDGGMRLSVYVTGHQDNPPEARELREFLQTSLPEYMIPSDVVALPHIPLTSNGKIDRAALPTPTAQKTVSKPQASEQPLTGIEKRLLQLWRELLDTQAVSPGDDFFDLGGHSLLVAALQNRIREEFGLQVNLAALFHAPTLQQQAALIQSSRHTETPGLIPFHAEGSRPPIFWLHPQRQIRNVIPALGNDQPVFGLALNQDDLPATGDLPVLEDIAGAHARTIIEAHPEGPYFLAGLCTGGIVAFETAKALQAAGKDVALVVLVDSQNPAFYKRIGSPAVALNKLHFYLRMLFRNRSSEREPIHEQLLWRMKNLVEPEPAKTELGIVEQAVDAAAYRYKPSAYQGTVLLLQPMERPAAVDYRPGWLSVAPNLVAKDVQGHHDQLFIAENVESVANAIRASVLEADIQPTPNARD